MRRYSFRWAASLALSLAAMAGPVTAAEDESLATTIKENAREIGTDIGREATKAGKAIAKGAKTVGKETAKEAKKVKAAVISDKDKSSD